MDQSNVIHRATDPTGATNYGIVFRTSGGVLVEGIFARLDGDAVRLAIWPEDSEELSIEPDQALQILQLLLQIRADGGIDPLPLKGARESSGFEDETEFGFVYRSWYQRIRSFDLWLPSYKELPRQVVNVRGVNGHCGVDFVEVSDSPISWVRWLEQEAYPGRLGEPVALAEPVPDQVCFIPPHIGWLIGLFRDVLREMNWGTEADAAPLPVLEVERIRAP
jgi:hypothetical protein